MKIIEKTSDYEIVEFVETYGSDFVVYDANERLVRTCPSIGMAREVAAGLEAN